MECKEKGTNDVLSFSISLLLRLEMTLEFGSENPVVDVGGTESIFHLREEL